MSDSKEKVKNLHVATAVATRLLDRGDKKKLRISRSFFLSVHEYVLRDKPEYAGRFRMATDEICVGRATFKPAESWELEHKMQEFIDFVNNRKKWRAKFNSHILNKSATIKKSYKKFTYEERQMVFIIFISFYIHHKFVEIHPFCDGNGRVARLLMCFILRHKDLSSFTYPILINKIINKNKNKYLNALNMADKGNYLVGVEYTIKLLQEAYVETSKEMRKKRAK